jgi:biotin carboxylase
MSKVKSALVLGGTYPHIELIKQLKSRGYNTILIDYLAYSPATEYADEHIRESTLEKEIVLKIAKEKNVSLVIATCIDQANVTACYVAEKLDLPRPYSYNTASLIADKTSMKAKLINCGIATSRYVEFLEKEIPFISEHKLDGLSYPLIIKPSDSNGSKGVIKVNTFNNLVEKALYSVSISRNKKIIIEEFIEGAEIGVDIFIKDKVPHVIMTRERVKKKESYSENTVQQISGSYWPAIINKLVESSIVEQAIKIVNEFGLDNCPLLIQGIIKDNKFWIIEFAPRIGGGDNYDIIKIKTGFDIIDASISSFLKEDVNVKYNIDDLVHYDMYLYGEKGILNSVKIEIDPSYERFIHHKKIYKKNGALLSGDLTSSDRIGVILLKGNTQKEIRDVFNNKMKVVIN